MCHYIYLVHRHYNDMGYSFSKTLYQLCRRSFAYNHVEITLKCLPLRFFAYEANKFQLGKQNASRRIVMISKSLIFCSSLKINKTRTDQAPDPAT